MQIIVAGGAGFIGSHLCELLAKKHHVIVLDDFSTGKIENIEDLNVTWFEHNVIYPFKNRHLKPEVIFNLASPASPVDYQNRPIQTSITNSHGTYNLLELARKNNAKFIQASTSEIYGDPLEHPQKETYWGNVNPIGLRSCYDEGKRFAESLCMDYRRNYSLRVSIARIFNTYGEKMQINDGRIIPTFINQALKKEPITIFGTGKQTRSFCHISDLASGLEKIMEWPTSDVYNLGNPEEKTILEIAQKIKSFVRSKSEIIFRPLPQDDPLRRKPDITKAKKVLNWQPKINLDEGLSKTIKWFGGRISKRM